MAAPHDVIRLVVLLALAASNGAAGERRRGSRLGALAGSQSNRVLDEVDPDAVIERVDVDALLARVDLDALLARVDPDLLLERVAVNDLLDRVDVDRLLDRVEVDALLDRVDVDRLLERADVDALLEGVEVNALLDRVDIDALLDRVDVDRLLARADVDATLDRVDVERLLKRVDIEDLVRRAGIPELIADSTGQVAGSALDLVRRQLVGVDVGLQRIVQRLLRRDPDALPQGPPLLMDEHHQRVEAPDPHQSRVRARIQVSGFYAGPVSRALAFGADIGLATVSFTFTVAVLSWLVRTTLWIDLEVGALAGPWWAGVLVVWFFLYWWLSTMIAGRTPAMLLLGLTIVDRDGAPLRPWPALVRTLTLPLSMAFLGIGAIGIVLDLERRAVHDLLARSTVVYDWGGRPAELPTPISRWIAEHGGEH